MNKIIKKCIFCTICVLAFSFLQAQDKGYTIEVLFNGLPNGTVLELLPGSEHSSNETPIAEKVIINEKAVFSGCLKEPRSLFIKVKGFYGGVKCVIGNENVTILANAKKMSTEQGDKYEFTDELVKGSEFHQEYLAKYKPRKDVEQEFYKMQEGEFKEIRQKLNEAYTSNDKEIIKLIQQTEDYKELSRYEGRFFRLMDSICTKVITDNGNTWWGPFMMLDFMSYFTKEQQPIYLAFSKEAKESYYGKLVFEELFPVGMIGQKLPDFNVTKENGERTSHELLRAGKKYILLDFWASWCGPCRREIPNLKSLYAKYKDKGFEIISISTDKDEVAWRKALTEEKLTWPNFRDGSVADIYKVRSIPAMFLMDSNGVLISDSLRGEELANKLDELF